MDPAPLWREVNGMNTHLRANKTPEQKQRAAMRTVVILAVIAVAMFVLRIVQQLVLVHHI
jgi:hypothetical protein